MKDSNVNKFRLAGAAVILLSLMFAWILLTHFDDHYASNTSQPMVVQPIEVEAFAVPPKPIMPEIPVAQVSDTPSLPGKKDLPEVPASQETTKPNRLDRVLKADDSSKKAPHFAQTKPDGRVDDWVLQVGSFSEKKNAEVLKKKLLEKNYPAYVKVFTIKNRQIFRVLVGPKINKAAMQKMAKNIDALFRLNSLIMEYKPGFAE